MNTRRQFMIRAPLAAAAAVAACQAGVEQKPAAGMPAAGTPPAFNTAPPVGPEVSSGTFAEAEKLAQVTLTDAQRAMAAKSWRTSLAALLERRTGPRTIALEAELAPASVWDPLQAAAQPVPTHDRFVRSAADVERLYATIERYVERLAAWGPVRCATVSEAASALGAARVPPGARERLFA